MDNRELRAADLLGNHLLDAGLRLNNRMVDNFSKLEGPQTVLGIQRLISTNVFAEAGGKTAQLMNNYLRLTLDVQPNDYFTWAQPNHVMLQAESKVIAEKIVLERRLQPLHESGPLLNSYVNDQIDRTIEAKPQAFGERVRHLNPGACDICIEWKEVYDNGGWWYRHANCRCYSVRR